MNVWCRGSNSYQKRQSFWILIDLLLLGYLICVNGKLMMVSFIDENKKEGKTSTTFFWLTEAHKEYINMIASPHLFINKKKKYCKKSNLHGYTICKAWRHSWLWLYLTLLHWRSIEIYVLLGFKISWFYLTTKTVNIDTPYESDLNRRYPQSNVRRL